MSFQVSAGETSSPSQVKRDGISPACSKAGDASSITSVSIYATTRAGKTMHSTTPKVKRDMRDSTLLLLVSTALSLPSSTGLVDPIKRLVFLVITVAVVFVLHGCLRNISRGSP